MKRGKNFGGLLNPKHFNFFNLVILVCFIFIDNFQLTTSQIIQLNGDIDKFLAERQTSTSDDEKLHCQYRDLKLSQEHFSIWSSYGCYSFIRPDLIVNTLSIILCNFNGVGLPVLNVTNTCEHTFSITNPTVQQAIQYSYSNANVYNRWLTCSQDAIDCCENHLLGKPDKGNHCSPLWDGFTCFTEYTRAGEEKEMVCSKYAYSGAMPQCTHYSSKTCFNNASWNVTTNYEPCLIAPRLIPRTKWHISMLAISIIISFPGLLILFVYKQLYTQKYFMIRNLITALICRNLLVLISKSTIIMDELENQTIFTIMAYNGAGCRILTFFEKMAANFVFTCMLLEGIYLHQLLTNVFGTRRNAGVVKMLHYYIAGSLISIITALVWGILMAVHYDTNCWAVTDGNNLHWINDSPRLLMLLINTILLVHIVIVMWKTFRSKTNEDNPGLRTARAALICLPLFGVPFLFIIFRPTTSSCGWEQFYYFVSYALEGLQCIGVVIFHCYLDRELQRLVKRSFQLLQETLNFGKNKKRLSKYEGRRTTYSTCAESRPNIERSAPSSPIPDNGKNNLNCPIASTPAENPEKNHSIVYDNSQLVNSQINNVSLDPLYENLPPLRSQIVSPKDSLSNNPVNAELSKTDNNVNNTNNFFVNNDQENIFDSYYNDNNTSAPTTDYVEPSTKNSSQLKQSNDFKDDVKLDPKIFFKNRANGIQFVDDDSQY